MKIDADRLNDNSLEDSTTSGCTASTGFTLTSFSGQKVNGVTTINVLANRSGASVAESSAGSGNIAETDFVTLPAAYRPPANVDTIWGNGTNDGEATVISATGVILLRTTSGAPGVGTGTNIRVSATWVSGNT
ncbi:hypothetical protein [Streptomyces sp. NPDC088794]|uniref:hypothetical protein n=1 Tax=Streptomyces sp. NPDC088794 TaxID=3365902 RepID=UPI0037FB549A